jgi:hypothetical protein
MKGAALVPQEGSTFKDVAGGEGVILISGSFKNATVIFTITTFKGVLLTSGVCTLGKLNTYLREIPELTPPVTNFPLIYFIFFYSDADFFLRKIYV